MAFHPGNKHQTTKKLTYGKVQDMRTKYEHGATQGALAREYGVSVVQVGRIVRGEVWIDAGQAVGEGTRLPPPDVLTDPEEIQKQAERIFAQYQQEVAPKDPMDYSAVEQKKRAFLDPNFDPLEGLDPQADMENSPDTPADLTDEEIAARKRLLGR